ncbi:PREDICTED: CASP-like protein 4C1 [Ipomoea nil]|uniref:CASP-like protein 4C1 n=1 Tax=Ipomoea nil TaxID=35883 RepID=UPI000901C774|nr:PREDICTED: CASP-like protein 4C1 [Ipomoea nil]
MASPQQLRNGGVHTPSPGHRIQPPFHSTVSVHKLRRVNILILIFRFAAFCFSLAAAVFMLSNSHDADSPNWHQFDAFRFVAVANAIVAVYSFFEVGASVWEISRGATVFPEVIQVWFDFGHDQVFAYMSLSAAAVGTAFARTLHGMDTCTDDNAFCVQSYISIALGFAGFVFLGLSSLVSGYRVVCFVIHGSRFHL